MSYQITLTHEHIDQAAKLHLERPCKYITARDNSFRGVHPSSPEADSFCLIGALANVMKVPVNVGVYEFFDTTFPTMQIASLNDRDKHVAAVDELRKHVGKVCGID